MAFGFHKEPASKESCGNGVNRKPGGAPPYHTNAPLEDNCSVAGCHDGITGTPNTGPGVFNLTIGNSITGYVPTKLYVVKVSLTQTGCDKLGFQATSLRDFNDSPTGIVSLIDTGRTQIFDNQIV